ncbi:MAG: endonuclease domain-containing protein [Proteobacteria bacterium]|nr:endonuclease domain-containing protein [Pseudomonadota bacterium]
MRPTSEPRTQGFARELRKTMTDTERRLWQDLRRGKIPGPRFRRQVPIGPYVADFACLKSRLIIELDGSQHVERATYDDQRTQFLEAQNFRVLRFWNGAMSNEREAVIETIVWAVMHPDWHQHRDPLPSPPPSGEGK